jgi:NAD-dependent SIR2 family protein deacetylase
MKTAIFLGAGASAAEGAPTQNALFQKYFSSRNIQNYPDMFHELSDFFKAMFLIDLNDPIDGIKFPTFEEALGILDLAEMRRESFRGFDFAGAAPHGNKAQLIRLYLVLVMSKAIADGLSKSNEPPSHQPLVQHLKDQDLFDKTIFISTNYDVVIDDALGFDVDYGVEFSGPNRFGSQATASPTAIKLFKLHGSLNWLFCPVCNNLNSYESKAVLGLLSEGKPRNQCGRCQSLMAPVIVPPTFYKDMTRVFLSSIWNKTENALREVDHVIFCGYSLPDADMHVKYLLKRMQTNRDHPESVRFTVFNHKTGKTNEEEDEEERRYRRYFGGKVKYTRESFQKFAQDPKAAYVNQ